MTKKDNLPTIVLSSLITSGISFLVFGYISASSLPYQDPPPELLRQYNEFIETYTPVMYTAFAVFVVSFITFCISGAKLVMREFGKS
jgi:hypothetical protein